VTYDIPQEQKNDRERLRYHLKKIGCGRLQNSVWITPYNPQTVLEGFIKQGGLEGAVIISSVGDKETVGEETLEDLVSRVYNLDDLHWEYLQFNKKYFRYKRFKPETKRQVIFDFLSVLKDDPQLPFKLLPEDWAGSEAYEIFKKATKGKAV
jgi:phenylacetic acid degradation operon negative regulatory protein